MKKHHGIKWQLVELPNGMTFDMFGPISFRENDLTVIRLSNLNNRLVQLQSGENSKYKLYGDRIFVFEECVMRAHEGPQLTQQQIDENRAMTKQKNAVEWDFAYTSLLCTFTQYWLNIKLRKHENHKLLYFVATLIRNALVTLRGSQTSRYFDCEPPTLEEWMNVN